ncbi:GlpM family protein [Pseudogulbenkiania subflava]|uniref:Uncharacterized membrane protein, GlpM family n=1 Tax=Pseudogulbenkiania subflava DSM 22618 TaxID=1123014 RepID=A0A1Y6BBJ7_9NEIS|nr:GlpM family protein [Pseudogulbenkiania subflava]SME99347.1 Uncharacterized membrane protein, GlpM family [Pseudogulbenkiania subflava DSM 22618]
MALFLKALLGSAAVLLIAVLSKSKHYFIAGLVPLFPTFALIAHYLVGTERSVAELKTTIVFGMWSLIPYFVYLAAVYLLADRLRLGWALFVAALCWAVAAWGLVLAWGRWHG